MNLRERNACLDEHSLSVDIRGMSLEEFVADIAHTIGSTP